MRVEPEKKPRSKSPLEAAYCAAWNAHYAAEDRFACMFYCTNALRFADNLQLNEHQMIREKIGEAQKYWGLQCH